MARNPSPCPWGPHHPNLHNVAALLRGGRVCDRRAKQLLPNYDVFAEPRYFVAGAPAGPLGELGVLLCEDLWDEGYPARPLDNLREARWLACLSASPYRRGIAEKRLQVARKAGQPLVYVNAVGAHDELIFDGGSFALDAHGQVVAQLPRFEEAVHTVDWHARAHRESDPDEELFEALCLGIRDFVAKNGLRRAVLGLSGGVDSALVACLAREALGPERVLAVAMPSRFTDPRSTECARELAANLGIGFKAVPLEPLHQVANVVLGTDSNVEENAQARLRALILLAELNREGGVLLNTSNKTELSLGYGTLHGDMAGTLAPIGDLTKPQVQRLAAWFQRESGAVPPFTLERLPSAELREGQVDPFDYPALAPQLEEEMERYALSGQAEHKRRQFGIVLKTSRTAFGMGRQVPITSWQSRLRDGNKSLMHSSSAQA